jgi:malate dehydrogenase
VKLVVVGGGGGVGSSVAFNVLLGARATEVVLVDSCATQVESHAMDFAQVLEQSPGSSLRAGTDSDLVDADVVVVTAGVPLAVNSSRLVYLEANAQILDGVAHALPPAWPGVAIVVTNPVDPLVTRFQARTGIDRRRVLGYTLNDSLRLRTGVARALGLAPGAVAAWVLGEHGETGVPIWSRVEVDGEARTLRDAEKVVAEEYLRTWYVRHVALDSGRTSTWTTGLGVARMVAAICAGTNEVWPASLVLDGEYGLADVAVTVPVRLGTEGAAAVLEWPLDADEYDALHNSAATVRLALETLAAA